MDRYRDAVEDGGVEALLEKPRRVPNFKNRVDEETESAVVDYAVEYPAYGHDRRPPKMIILDMDSSVRPTHGEQEGTAYNGHFGCTCYHPLFLFNQFGDLEICLLRSGNVHSAHEWRDVLEPVVNRYKERNVRLYCRGELYFRVGFIVTNLSQPTERVVAFYNHCRMAEQ